MRLFVFSLLAFGLNLVSALQYHGADFSSLLILEADGVQYRASSTATPQPFEWILHDFGVNLARIRIWTAKPYDLTYALKLAKRAKAAGMDILVALHYSDTWGDPGHQNIPSGWPTDLNGLVSHVYKHTHEVVEAFNAQDTPIQLIQIGNEVSDGLLWPTGRISTNGPDGASQLFHAGVLAVRKASPSTRTVIHLDNGWDQGEASWFYSQIFTKNGLTLSDVDVMGASMYPYYGTGATFANLKSSMHYLLSTYNKDVILVETGFPAACDTKATPLSEPSIPVDAQGQITWIKDMKAVLDSLNSEFGDKVKGIAYWECGWTTNPTLASTCSDVLLVTGEGVATEAMSMFSDM